MNNLILAGLLFALPLAGTAGEPSSRVSMDPGLLQKIKKADIGKGGELAATCGGCHGQGASFPSLDGQLSTYLYKQLQDYKDGHRSNPMMTGIASTLSDEDMIDLSAYYAGKPLPKGTGTPLKQKPTLANEGDSRRILPPCAACHDSRGIGQKLDIPALAGQNEAYLLQTLKEYKSGARHNDLYGRMRSIAKEMTDAEISEIVRYYAGMNR